MKRSALPWGLAFVAGFVAVYFWNQLQTERELTAQLRQNAPKAEESARAISVQPAPAAIVPAVSAAIDATVLPPPAGATVNNLPVTSAALPAVGVSASPYAGTMGGSLKRNELERRYPGVSKEFRLTPAEAEAFYDLLVKQEAALMNTAFQGSANVADARELQQKIAEIQKTHAAQLEAQLGADKSRQWQEYLTTVEARRRVSELTSMLASTSPITEQQAGPLVANIVAEQKRRAQEEGMRIPPISDPRSQLEFEEQNLAGRVESNRRTAEAARSFMNPEQIALMQDSQARANNRTRDALQARRAQLEAGGR